ncbi:DUF4232 domain-containing protein [Actinomadura sp. HBU206391]|uniref:DUF4232 domain-containing protein n=1 Tax=Actinomadura sp. HBU206391 TaxID=2731692 RepID=UPI00164FCD0B|nr:DUF4232 domain-containing protein [Actinomadura sp. HBU206391]MBC6461321.1 DUF4232 domain-containing protein [Actinomadura sp. HBU206391]
MVTSNAPHVGAVLAATLLSIALAGCASNDGGDAAHGPPGTSAPEPSGGQGGESTSGRAAAVPVSHDGVCRAGDLRLSLKGGDAAAGTSYRSLVFTNVSNAPCTVQGFPGVSYVAGDDGRQVGAPAVRDGDKSEPITLGGGEKASAVVGFVNVRNYDAVDCRPQPVRGVRVYPPEETTAKFVTLPGTGCANDKIQQLTVRALRAGDGR